MKKLIIFLIPIFLFSCSNNKELNNTFTIATWNAYCFFDSRDDGTEYTKFKVSSGYTEEKYENRISKTSKLLSSYFSDTDLIILEEIESDAVLEDLLNSGLRKRGFTYYGICNKGDGELAVGFISKIKPSYIRTHSPSTNRLILDLGFRLDGELVHVIGLHASSRLKSENEDKRFEEFSLVRTIFDYYNNDLTLALGDFNSDPNVSEKGLSYFSDDSNAPLRVSYDKGDLDEGLYYSPSVDKYSQYGKGTYYYQGTWFHFDNVLLNSKAFDGSGWEYNNAFIVTLSESLDVLGHPKAYEVSKGNGYSDHLPVKVMLKYN